MRKLRHSALVVAAAFVLAGCGGDQPAATIHSAGSQITAFVSPATVGEDARIRIRTSGPPLTQPLASAVYDMDDMPMSARRVRLAKTPEGYESSPLRFSMGGSWHITVFARKGSSEHPAFSFSVNVR